MGGDGPGAVGGGGDGLLLAGEDERGREIELFITGNIQ